MQVTIIPIVIDAFGTVTKGLLKGLEFAQMEATLWDKNSVAQLLCKNAY